MPCFVLEGKEEAAAAGAGALKSLSLVEILRQFRQLTNKAWPTKLPSMRQVFS